jgi:hypothetical protein
MFSRYIDYAVDEVEMQRDAVVQRAVKRLAEMQK